MTHEQIAAEIATDILANGLSYKTQGECEDAVLAILRRRYEPSEQAGEGELLNLADAAHILAAEMDDTLHPANADLERYFERGLLTERRDCTDEWVCCMTPAGREFVRAALNPKGPTP